MNNNEIQESKDKRENGILNTFDQAYFLKLARAKMPFGKYAGRLLVDLPETYIVWFNRKGFPKGELGQMLKEIYEIKVNGLEYLFAPLKRSTVNNNTGLSSLNKVPKIS
ncbi:hypothetical protein CHISP_2415 [Chitinispirillum alkaliphilum]|nr:hypothetical protein CHISP_2415 [Chitinispirillum alkaliphilum]